MTPDQAYELELLQKHLGMSDGTLRSIASEVGAGCGCRVRSLADLSRHQTGALIGRLRDIEARLEKKEELVSA